MPILKYMIILGKQYCLLVSGFLGVMVVYDTGNNTEQQQYGNANAEYLFSCKI